ncbi:MFS transporter [Rhodococcus sp. T2V]|uniref:MFS transporter n=1 Tax=Rhodococcus sp. T2V TaxID=3034164 RepID=UPI0023E11E45|nr:MFS transporter [Rhodococcus sp. T2V]MDF3306453.1 MFS transporter [Rhodococcus sp. T2V]
MKQARYRYNQGGVAEVDRGTATPTSPLGRSRSWRTTILVLAVVSSIAVSIGYLPQPLLVQIADDFASGAGAVGWVATAAQLGTACGILFLVPLADVVRPRRQIEVQLCLGGVTLLGAAAAPGIAALCLAVFIAGLMANVAQLIMPLAVRTAPDGQQARTTGVLAGSLLFGIFGGRVLAGVIGAHLGWRSVFVTTAMILFGSIVLLRIVVSSDVRAPAGSSYLALLRSLPRVAQSDRAITESSLIQAFSFAAFDGLWTVLALYLTGSPVKWTAESAGLIGVVGLVAGCVTTLTGRVLARFGPRRTLAVSIALTLASATTIVITSAVPVVVVLAMFLLTVGNQVSQVANQSRALSGAGSSAGRANTVYMFGAFVGGSAGAAIGSISFDWFGIVGAALFASTSLSCAGLIWTVSCWRARRSRASTPATRDLDPATCTH